MRCMLGSSAEATPTMAAYDWPEASTIGLLPGFVLLVPWQPENAQLPEKIGCTSAAKLTVVPDGPVGRSEKQPAATAPPAGRSAPTTPARRLTGRLPAPRCGRS